MPNVFPFEQQELRSVLKGCHGLLGFSHLNSTRVIQNHWPYFNTLFLTRFKFYYSINLQCRVYRCTQFTDVLKCGVWKITLYLASSQTIKQGFQHINPKTLFRFYEVKSKISYFETRTSKKFETDRPTISGSR